MFWRQMNRIVHQAWPMDTDGDGGGGGGGGDVGRKLTPEEVMAQATAKLKSDGDAVKVIAELMTENYRLRKRQRTAVVLKPEEKKAFDAYLALGPVEEVVAKVNEHGSLLTFKEERIRKDQIHEVANVAGMNPVVLTDLAKARGLTLAVKDVSVKGEDGKTTTGKAGFVVVPGEGDKTTEVPIMEYVKNNLQDHMAALVAPKKGGDDTRHFPIQEPAANNQTGDAGLSPVVAEFLEQQSKAEAINPLRPATT